MYYQYYNPTLHDVYLYSPSNTGFPVSLNPNCILYGASASYSGISLRVRTGYTAASQSSASGVTLFFAPPPGTSEAYLTNYYNIPQNPLFHVVSPKTLSTCIHYSANVTSAALSTAGQVTVNANWTGTTGTYSPSTMYFWNSTYTGISAISGPWEVMYNMVPYSQISGVCGGFSFSKYFPTSPEIPLPEGAGNTFWLIMDEDNGFMDNGNPGITMNQTILKTISPGVVFKENKNAGSCYYISYLSGVPSVGQNKIDAIGSILITWQAQNVYFWDGCDRVIPVEYCQYVYTLNTKYLAVNATPASGIMVCWDPTGWPPLVPGQPGYIHSGDSSGKILYLKNNKLFIMGQATVASGSEVIIPQSGEKKLLTTCSNTTPASLFFGRYYHLEPHLEPYTFWQSGSTGLTLALQYHFDPIKSKIQQNISSLQNLLQTFKN